MQEIIRLKAESSWQRGDRNAKTLVKEPNLHLTLVLLKAGARLDQHQTAGPVVVQPLTGRVRLSAEGEQTELSVGQLLVVAPNVPHDVEAIEESALLLTIGWPE
jgi:quercetin dioxygenase-like cupin family protein